MWSEKTQKLTNCHNVTKTDIKTILSGWQAFGWKFTNFLRGTAVHYHFDAYFPACYTFSIKFDQIVK